MDPRVVAQELMAAYSSGQEISELPSGRDAAFDLSAGYAVEAELARLRRANGRTTVGRKVAYANKALWRALKLDTLVWAHMYDDTVQYAIDGAMSLSVGRMHAPRIEPEIVFKLKVPPGGHETDPSAFLHAVEWLALGFEIVDCRYREWKYQPSDFVAAFGLHAGLIVGAERRVEPAAVRTLVEQLARFTVRLSKDGQTAAEGGGKNVLRSPALCLTELASAISRRPDVEALAPGELVSSGSLTEARPIGPGETWTAEVEGIDLPPLTVHTRA